MPFDPKSNLTDGGLGEFRFESDNQAVNDIKDFLQEFQEWKVFDNLGFGERYVKDKLRILLHARLAGKEFVSVFERSSESSRESESAHRLSGAFPPSGNLNSRLSESKECEQHRMVLIGNVQFVEPPEFVCASLVRFGSVDCVYSSLPHALYLSSGRAYVLRGLKDRETGLSIRGVAINKDELIGEVIQGASEVVDSIARNDANFGWSGLDVSQIKDIVSRLRITLGSDYIRFAFDEPVSSDFEITEVLLGPLNFGAYER